MASDAHLVDLHKRPSPAHVPINYFQQQHESQNSIAIEASLLDPLEESQDSQPPVVDDLNVKDGSQEATTSHQMEKASSVPFVSRPAYEDPENMGFAFHYSKPNIPQPQARGLGRDQILKRPTLERSLPDLIHRAGDFTHLGIQRSVPDSSHRDRAPPVSLALSSVTHEREQDRGIADVRSPPVARAKHRAVYEGGHDNSTIDTRHPPVSRVKPGIVHDRDPDHSTIDVRAGGLHSPELVPSDHSSTEKEDERGYGEDIEMNDAGESPDDLPFPNPTTPVKTTKRLRSQPSIIDKPKLPKAVVEIQQRAMAQASPRHYRHAQRKSSPMSNTGEGLAPRHSSLVGHEGVKQVTKPSRHRRSQDPESHIGDLTSPHHSTHLHKSQRGRYLNTREKARPTPPRILASPGAHRRPESQASNISKKRSYSRVAERLSQLDHRASFPQKLAGISEFAEAWNTYVTNANKAQKEWCAQFNSMNDTITAQEEDIEGCQQEMAKQEEIITDLADKKNKAEAMCNEQGTRLAESEAKQQKLNDKLHKYKEHLNNAVQEQQKIFSYCRDKYQQMIEEQKAQEKKQRDSLEEAMETTKNERERIQSSISHVKTAAQQEMQQLTSKVDQLQATLVERQTEVCRERKRADDLHRELAESRFLTKETIESLAGEQKQQYEKDNQEKIKFQGDMERRFDQQSEQLQAILNILGSKEDNTALQHSKIVDSLKASQEQALDSVLSEVRQITASDRERSEEATRSLKEDTSRVRELFNTLIEKIESVLIAADWQAKYEASEAIRIGLIADVERLKAETAETEAEIDEIAQNHQTLIDEIGTLKHNLAADDQALTECDQKIEVLEGANKQLSQESYETKHALEQAQEKLSLVEHELDEAKRQLGEKKVQLELQKAEYQDFMKSSDEQREVAVRDAVAAEVIEYQIQIDQLQNDLREAEQNESNLLEELALAKQKAEDIQSIEQALALTTEVMEEISTNIEKAEQAKEKLSSTFENWADDRTDIAALKQIFSKLIEEGARLGMHSHIAQDEDDEEGTRNPEVQLLKRATQLAKIDRKKSRAKGKKIIEANAQDESVDEAAELRWSQNRRVMIKSPFTDDEDTEMSQSQPLSVEEEREMRRQAIQPKGILKPDSQQTDLHSSDAEVSPVRHIAGPSKKRTILSRMKSSLGGHSAYNRPVLGNAPHAPADEEPSSAYSEQERSDQSASPHRKAFEEDDIEDDDEPVPKRLKSAGKTNKICHSMKRQPSMMPKNETRARPRQRPVVPRMKREPSLITYGQRAGSAITV
ncbi:hypothetical protein F5Y16DRAFT_423384 [Xylariaceae sp. FL0255]|nr:hypothetical protein F5Y16DRAFT_423384 [Xylariaceae sp. FL0255]